MESNSYFPHLQMKKLNWEQLNYLLTVNQLGYGRAGKQGNYHLLSVNRRLNINILANPQNNPMK